MNNFKENYNILELPIGTEFFCCTGGWTGIIIKKYGEKHVKILENNAEYKLKNYEYPANKRLDIIIKGDRP